jgi:hypothetical protein
MISREFLLPPPFSFSFFFFFFLFFLLPIRIYNICILSIALACTLHCGYFYLACVEAAACELEMVEAAGLLGTTPDPAAELECVMPAPEDVPAPPACIA